MIRRLLILATMLALAACTSTGGTASDGDAPTTDDRPSAEPSATDAPEAPDADGLLVISDGAVADGPGVTVEEALSGDAPDGPVLVNGSLFVDPDGTVRLCDALMESFPPQCGGARLLVEGAEPSMFPDLEEANGVRWAERVQLFGRVTPTD